MKKMSFLLFLALILTQSLTAFAETSPEGDDAGDEEVARTFEN